MSNEVQSVGGRFAAMAKDASKFGLWVFGLACYVAVLLVIAALFCKGIQAGKLPPELAVCWATGASAYLTWMVIGFRA